MRPPADWPDVPAGDGPAARPEAHAGVGLLAWLAGLVAAIALLHLAGRGVLAPPAPTPGAVSRWLAERDAVTVAFAVARLLASVAAWYLLASTLLGLVVRLGPAGRLVAWADLATVPAVRRLVSGAVGVGLTATSAAVAAPPVSRPVATVSAVDPAAEPSDPDVEDGAVLTRLPGGTATLRRLPADRPPPAAVAPSVVAAPAPPAADPAEAAAAPAAEPAPAPDPAPRAARTWVIEPGDHLWAVAADTLADAWRRPPTDEETAAYWRTLVAANQPRLADPSNPDLVFPGDVVTLPPLPRAAP